MRGGASRIQKQVDAESRGLRLQQPRVSLSERFLSAMLSEQTDPSASSSAEVHPPSVSRCARHASRETDAPLKILCASMQRLFGPTLAAISCFPAVSILRRSKRLRQNRYPHGTCIHRASIPDGKTSLKLAACERVRRRTVASFRIATRYSSNTKSGVGCSIQRSDPEQERSSALPAASQDMQQQQQQRRPESTCPSDRSSSSSDGSSSDGRHACARAHACFEVCVSPCTRQRVAFRGVSAF